MCSPNIRPGGIPGALVIGWDAGRRESAQLAAAGRVDPECGCMPAKGYTLGNPNTTEAVLGVVFAPVWLPRGALVAVGEGMSGEPRKRWIGRR